MGSGTRNKSWDQAMSVANFSARTTGRRYAVRAVFIASEPPMWSYGIRPVVPEGVPR